MMILYHSLREQRYDLMRYLFISLFNQLRLMLLSLCFCFSMMSLGRPTYLIHSKFFIHTKGSSIGCVRVGSICCVLHLAHIYTCMSCEAAFSLFAQMGEKMA